MDTYDGWSFEPDVRTQLQADGLQARDAPLMAPTIWPISCTLYPLYQIFRR